MIRKIIAAPAGVIMPGQVLRVEKSKPSPTRDSRILAAINSGNRLRAAAIEAAEADEVGFDDQHFRRKEPPQLSIKYTDPPKWTVKHSNLEAQQPPADDGWLSANGRCDRSRRRPPSDVMGGGRRAGRFSDCRA